MLEIPTSNFQEFWQEKLLYECTLTPRLSQELLWNRFINTHSVRGCNIPCNRYLEHLNRLCKDSVRNLQANKTVKAIVRVGKTLGTIAPVLDNYDNVNNVTHASGHHKVPSSKKDIHLTMEHLLKLNIFTYHDGRVPHSCFRTPRDVSHSIDKNALVKWITKHI